MKKKTIPLLALMTSLLAIQSVPAPAQSPQAEFSYKWDLAKTVSTSAGTTIIGNEPGNNIVLLEGCGVKVDSDSEVPGGKALVFDGSQTAPIMTQGRVAIGENIRVTALIKPEDNPAAPTWQTIFYMFQQCELRYMVNRGQLIFIVWHGDGGKTVTEVGVPITPNKWNTVEANLVGSTLELKINGTAATAVIPDNGRKKIMESAISFGHGDKRPFTGRVADVVIATPKFN